MCLEANRDMSHYEIQQMLWRKAAAFADYANIEQRLPNGKRADVFYQVGPTTIIIEVKTVLKESLFDNAYLKYAEHCDYLVIAAPPQLVTDDRHLPAMIRWRSRVDEVGIWLVERDKITEARPPCRLRMQTLGHVIHMAPAWSLCAVIASPGCTAPQP